jgi:hypothetical protein
MFLLAAQPERALPYFRANAGRCRRQGGHTLEGAGGKESFSLKIPMLVPPRREILLCLSKIFLSPVTG